MNLTFWLWELELGRLGLVGACVLATFFNKAHSTLREDAQESRDTKPRFKELIANAARVSTERNTCSTLAEDIRSDAHTVYRTWGKCRGCVPSWN